MVHLLPTLTIDQSAIAENTRVIARRATGALMAVVKADSFGHGDQSDVVLANGASSLGVTSLEEALLLREGGVTVPILSWLNSVDADFAAGIAAGVDIAVPGLDHLFAVATAARSARRRARIHLHIDTGMTRDGAAREIWAPLCEFARQWERQGAVQVVGIMGHLSSADEPADPRNTLERMVFVNAVRTAHRRGLRPRVRHLAATAATLTQPDAHFDLSRVGAGLFGIDVTGTMPLRGAMTLSAPVVQLREVPAGTGVGYGHSYVTDRRTRLALVPLGYADGVPRAASGRASVFIRGVRRRIVGSISMDQFVVDVGDDTLALGESVTVFGPGGTGEPTVAEWAGWSGTIDHEILTGIGRRVTRDVLRPLPVSGDADVA